MGYLKSVGTTVIYIGLFLAVITFIPGLPPDVEFREFSIEIPHAIDPKLGPKNRLTNAERLFEGKLLGPEAFAAYNGKIYTGIYQGYVLRIEEDNLVPVVKFGEDCNGIWQEQKCGRILGLKFDKKGSLYVVDTYKGIFKVNVATGEYKNIVNISEPIKGKISALPNSIDVTENGDLYWSISSTDYTLQEILMTFLANPTGRLIRYNAAKKKNEVLLENLGFANGVLLSEDESFVLVSETLKLRIIKYHLKGPKAGQHEVFIKGLPGMPDNIQHDGQGGFLITMVIGVNSEHPHISISLASHPYIRKMFARLIELFKLPFKLLHKIYPCTFTERATHAIGSHHLIGDFFISLKKSLVLRIDPAGNIMEILSSDDDTINGISEAYIYNDFVWFGSPWRNYVARVPLKQAFPDLANNEKQSSRTENENVKSERAKRDTISTSAPTTSKPTPTTTTIPTTTSKPTAASTTSKPTAAPKQPPTAKVDKPTTMNNNNEKPSEIKPTSKNAEVKKKSTETVNDPKLNTKSKPQNEKSKTDNKKEDAAKKNIKSGNNVKVEQDAFIKEKIQKSPPEKIKSAKTNRPKEDL